MVSPEDFERLFFDVILPNPTVYGHFTVKFSVQSCPTNPWKTCIRSAAYFTSLANGEPLPVKRRLEPVVSGSGLTVGNLDVLVQQHKSLENKTVTTESIKTKWGKLAVQKSKFWTKNLADLGLPATQLSEILQLGNFGDEFNFDFFTGVACLTLSGSVSMELKGPFWHFSSK